MEHDYKNIISHIDIDRSLGTIEYSAFEGMESANIIEFKSDIEAGNDSIEMHLVKSKAYKESLILNLKNTDGNNNVWRDFLKEEQKTFGGSKIFYINDGCGKLLVLSLPNELKNKVNMVITRLNKINEKISRINARTRKENLDLFASRQRGREALDKRKEEIINFINENFRA